MKTRIDILAMIGLGLTTARGAAFNPVWLPGDWPETTWWTNTPAWTFGYNSNFWQAVNENFLRTSNAFNLMPTTNGFVGSGVTNGLLGSGTAANTYQTISGAATTNGFVGAGVTNGLATINWVGENYQTLRGNVGVGVAPGSWTFRGRGTYDDLFINSSFNGLYYPDPAAALAGVCIESYTNNLTIGPALDYGVSGARLTLSYYNGSSYLSALEYTNTSSGYSSLALMKNGGRVGIGTASPEVACDVASGNMRVTGYGAPTGGVGLEFGFSAQGYIYSLNRTTSAYQNIDINDVLYINGASSVGIGVQNGVSKLSVAGTVGCTAVVITNLASAPTVSATSGCLWNSNSVLYWVTSTKTVLLGDGR